MARVQIDRYMHCAGEKLEVVKKQLKVQKKQQKTNPVKDSPKKKLKGIRIRKGVRIRVSSVSTCVATEVIKHSMISLHSMQATRM